MHVHTSYNQSNKNVRVALLYLMTITNNINYVKIKFLWSFNLVSFCSFITQTQRVVQEACVDLQRVVTGTAPATAANKLL